MSAFAYVGVGSNVDPERNILLALELLRRRATVSAVSTFFRTPPAGTPPAGTPPVGGGEQPPYLNGVWRITLRVGDSPQGLKRALREIEDRLGRRRSADRYAPRTIDLDLVLYDELVLKEEGLELPDPDIYRRPFLSFPLAELDPQLVMPDSGRSIQEVTREQDPSGMQPLEGFTRRLQRLLLSEAPENGSAGESGARAG
jgi:2-amino-4-hydroxy-6-hydroxymethyldihydropteridine diphosphokinase